jgi:hypothetical protein
MGKYQDLFNESIQNPEQFWKEQSEIIHWFQEPKTILSKDKDDL